MGDREKQPDNSFKLPDIKGHRNLTDNQQSSGGTSLEGGQHFNRIPGAKFAVGPLNHQLAVIKEDQSVSQSQDKEAQQLLANAKNKDGIQANVTNVRQILHQMRKYSRGVKDIIETGTSHETPAPHMEVQGIEET